MKRSQSTLSDDDLARVLRKHLSLSSFGGGSGTGEDDPEREKEHQKENARNNFNVAVARIQVEAVKKELEQYTRQNAVLEQEKRAYEVCYVGEQYLFIFFFFFNFFFLSFSSIIFFLSLTLC